MRSSKQRPAPPREAAAKHPPAVPWTATRCDTGPARKLTVDRAGPKLVRRYLPRGLPLSTDAGAEVSR